MSKIVIALLFLFQGTLLYGQEPLLVLSPGLGRTPDFREKTIKEIKRKDALLEKENLTKAEREELRTLLESYTEGESVWDILAPGDCSWYCGEGPYKVTASSTLDSTKTANYRAGNAHDLSYQTAWAEGVPGDGVGQYLEYYFKNKSPRVNKIKIYNGYVKSDKAWANNSRVKKLKLYVNDEPFALLDLEDATSEQVFNVPLLGHRADGKDLVLKFEILEVYKGKKYADTVITEIFFDGIDVH